MTEDYSKAAIADMVAIMAFSVNPDQRTEYATEYRKTYLDECWLAGNTEFFFLFMQTKRDENPQPSFAVHSANVLSWLNEHFGPEDNGEEARWAVVGNEQMHYLNGVIFFKNAADAVSFKLRWM